MIPDNYKLLGLIINTLPFDYIDGKVEASFSAVTNVMELEDLRHSIQTQIDNLPETSSDYEKQSLTDDLFFVNTMIDNLTGKV